MFLSRFWAQSVLNTLKTSWMYLRPGIVWMWCVNKPLINCDQVCQCDLKSWNMHFLIFYFLASLLDSLTHYPLWIIFNYRLIKNYNISQFIMTFWIKTQMNCLELRWWLKWELMFRKKKLMVCLRKLCTNVCTTNVLCGFLVCFQLTSLSVVKL